MSFESGSVGFRAFYMPRALPEDAVERFARHAVPPINTLSSGEIAGWVTGRHLLDRLITADNAHYGGYLRLTLMKAERKIPESLLRAECQIEELAVLQAEGLAYLPRAKRSEIKKTVRERLLPEMPPSLTGIPTVYDANNDRLYAGAMSDKQVDALVLSYRDTTGISPVPMTAITAAMKLKHFDATLMQPTSYSPEMEDPLAGSSVGQDFLTWLWFYSEARGGMLSTEIGRYGIMIEGPLTFMLEGDGAHVTVLRKGAPEVSTEAKTCLLGGKKLLKARLTIGAENESWTTALDAEDFIFRGFKMPKFADVDAISRYQQRVLSLNRFISVFESFYEKFLSERIDKGTWPVVQKEIHKWVAGRESKR
ncbi:MAG: recombination-associated protein RdgC [Kiritimatiellia bacterium]|jgi:hypothetical protein|nr:recombination-associated protein RdgC [Kiritimatiellia bacterium]MDP6847678.1 recombination-associated protein RdgC [Kiritimatiellia bacterium]